MAQPGTGERGDPSPVLVIGPVGSLAQECAREIHRNNGDGPFERVTCTPDSAAFRVHLFGPPVATGTEFPPFDREPPNSTLRRALGGTLFLDHVDRCNPKDVDWMHHLVARRPVTVNGHAVSLDPNTRVIASITTSWMGPAEYAIPNWLESICRWRVVVLSPLGSRPDDVLEALSWFSWEVGHDGQSVEEVWSREAKDLLLGRHWPGGYEELRDVVRTLMAARAQGMITLDLCERVVASYQGPGMRAIDNYRRQESYEYAQGLVYMGRAVSAREVYDWVGQLTRVARNRRFDPWLTGLRIVRDVSNKYYYSSDRLRMLIRSAYSSLCIELAGEGYIQEWPSGELPPSLRALLINPLGRLKSAAGVLPHMAHLLGAGTQQGVVSVKDVADMLNKDEKTRVLLFCDDFAGTGQQILSNLVYALSNDRVLKGVCESRSRKGNPVALGIVLGVGFTDAIRRIRLSGPNWLTVFAHAGQHLEDSDRAFSDTSLVFPEAEFRAWSENLVVDHVGKSLSPRWPGGFDNLQALVVTADNTPNDTIPALWKSGLVDGMAWNALFKRASSPAG